MEDIVGRSYAEQGANALQARRNMIDRLLQQRSLPQHGWDEGTMEMLMNELALMDSNNMLGNIGLGEREGRIICPMVARRHFRLAHGVGRSGDIAAIQPKAAGSSTIAVIAKQMVLDLLRKAGLQRVKSCIVLPVATGMALVLTFLTLRQQRPHAKYIIWCRIDQKTCFKAIGTAGYTPIVVDGMLEGDQIVTNVQGIRSAIERHGAENIAAVVTTTSCFAPRAPDSVEEVAELCRDADVPHVINNAYGVQASKCTHIINEAIRRGRVDAIVQSTDKNFMVPVGGSVIACPDKQLVKDISKTYPGRASATPVIDLFLTLLSLGWEGYQKLLQEQKENYAYLKERLEAFAATRGERVLHVPRNPISMCLSLVTIRDKMQEIGSPVTAFGSMLFTRVVSGARVVSCQDTKEINGCSFQGYGAHIEAYPTPYITVAAAIGMQKDEVDVFISRLIKVFDEIDKKISRRRKTDQQTASAAQQVPEPVSCLLSPIVLLRVQKS